MTGSVTLYYLNPGQCIPEDGFTASPYENALYDTAPKVGVETPALVF